MTPPATLYIVWTDYGHHGQGIHNNAETIFDDAVVEYRDARDKGQPAIVWCINTPPEADFGIVTNVTKDADKALLRWGEANNHENTPAWLIQPPCATCERYVCSCDDAYEARVSDDLHRWAAQ